MDTFVDERDFSLLEHDRYTFFVLHRIIGGSCRLLLSDHENLIFIVTTMSMSIETDGPGYIFPVGPKP